MESEATSAATAKNVHLADKNSLRADAPPVLNPYSMKNSMSDLPCAAYAIDLFLASHMLESEDYLHKGDPNKWRMVIYPIDLLLISCCFRERLYFATGYGLIQCVKALMSYDDNVCHYFIFNIIVLSLTKRISVLLGLTGCNWPHSTRLRSSPAAS